MVSAKTVGRRVLFAAAMSWIYSVTLGLILALRAVDFTLRNLLLPGVLTVAVLGSTEASLLVLPFAVWAVRTGRKNLCFYGLILWAMLAGYILAVLPKVGGSRGFAGLLVLAIVGLVTLGFIPPAANDRFVA
jgi:hypothetical protein